MNYSLRCNLLLCDRGLYPTILDPPHEVVGVLGHLATTRVEVGRAKLMLHAIAVYSPAICLTTSEVYGIVHTKVYECLREVVEGLLREALYHEYLTATLTDGTAHRLIFWLVSDEYSIIDQGVLAEEVATAIYSLFEEWRIVRNAHRNLTIDRGAVAAHR